jgi:hypothetical protein
MSALRLLLVLGIVLAFFAASLVLEQSAAVPRDFPTGPAWQQHRQKAREIEERMLQTEDKEEVERLRREHDELNEEWKRALAR